MKTNLNKIQKNLLAFFIKCEKYGFIDSEFEIFLRFDLGSVLVLEDSNKETITLFKLYYKWLFLHPKIKELNLTFNKITFKKL